MRRLLKITIILLLLPFLITAGYIILFTGCIPPSPEMETELSLSDAPVLGKPVKVTFTFALYEGYKLDAKNTTAKIMVPEGFEVVESDLESREELIEDSRIEAEIYEELDEKAAESKIRAELDQGSILIEDPVTGDKVFYKRYAVLEWHGDVLRDKTYTIQATIKSVKTGDWVLQGNAHYSFPDSHDILGGGDSLYISVAEDSANVYDKHFPLRFEGVPRYDAEDPDKPPVIIPFKNPLKITGGIIAGVVIVGLLIFLLVKRRKITRRY